MLPLLPARIAYSRAEDRSDAAVHLAGLVVVAVGVPVLVVLAAVLHGDLPAVLATAVYGATLGAMILFSALYNTIGRRRWTGLLQRLDHSAIFAKIAGTYTPFTLLPGGHGLWFLTGLWGAALAGMGLKLIAPHRLKWLALALYLGMGWAGLFAGGAFLGDLTAPVVALICVGGAIYTLGVAFYLFDRLPFHYTIWHVCVLVASMVFYAAVTVHLVATSA